MSEVENAVQIAEVLDANEVVEIKKPTATNLGFASASDTDLMGMMLDRNLEIPLDNGNLVRRAAIDKLKSYEEAAKPLRDYRRMRVIFHRSGKEAESPYVFMSLNGTAYQAPYEKEVSIPEPVIRGCIDTAVVTEYEMKDFDPASGSTRYEERVIRAVPYTFLGYEEARK